MKKKTFKIAFLLITWLFATGHCVIGRCCAVEQSQAMPCHGQGSHEGETGSKHQKDSSKCDCCKQSFIDSQSSQFAFNKPSLLTANLLVIPNYFWKIRDFNSLNLLNLALFSRAPPNLWPSFYISSLSLAPNAPPLA